MALQIFNRYRNTHKKSTKESRNWEERTIYYRNLSFCHFVSFFLPQNVRLSRDQFIGKNHKSEKKRNFPAENFPFPGAPLGTAGQWSNQPENWKVKCKPFYCESHSDTTVWGSLAVSLRVAFCFVKEDVHSNEL